MKKKAQNLLKKIEKATEYHFNELTPSKIADVSGVYVIRQTLDQKTLYVGRTLNMRRRLYTNHLQGNLSTARLKKYLIEDEKVKVNNLQEAKMWIKNKCYFQYIELADSAERGKVEGLFNFFLDVKYLEVEH